VRNDAEELWAGLTSGAGLAAVLVSVAGGVGTLALVWAGRFEPARYTAAAAVAAIVAGWGFSQSPELLPGLTVEEAAAGRATLWGLVISIALGTLVLAPALALLFGLTLRGRFDAAEVEPEVGRVEPAPAGGGLPRIAIVALGCLAVGSLLLLVFESPWPNVLGGLFLVAFVGTGFVALAQAGARHEELS
jgi:cytochrome d ubiquinol oxidase subunit II